MSKIFKIRRGTKEEVEAFPIPLSELIHAYDTEDLYIGGNSSNVKITKKSSVYNILDYGAKEGDSTFDNASIIQNLIDSIYLKGGGTVLIPEGTFYLSSVQGIQSNMITPKPNVNIVGLGRQSILKIKDGMNAVGTKFNVIRHTSDNAISEINNVIFKDFTIDENGTNNLIPSGEFKDNVAIGIWRGKNIIIDNIQVLNNAGRQTFSLGDNTSPHSVENVVIMNCKTNVVPKSLNVFQTDHSTIYCQANKSFIFNNIIDSDEFTAIEDHSSNSHVYDNIITNCSSGMNLVATVTNKINTFVKNNVIENCRSGIVIWNHLGYTMSKLHIKDNIIKQNDNTKWCFNMTDQVQQSIDEIVIEGNSIEYVGTDFTKLPACFGVGRVSKLFVLNNIVKNFPSRVLDLQVINDDTELFIEGNKIFDCCKGEIVNYGSAFGLISLNTLKTVNFINNVIENTTASQFIKEGLKGNAPVDNMNIEGNTILNVPTELSYTALPNESIHVSHYGNGTPENVIVASLGSVYYDKSSGKKWVKKLQDNLVTGWRSEEYSSAIPVSGSYKTGDIVFDDTPTAGGYQGWICVTSGTPGTWKGFGLIEV